MNRNPSAISTALGATLLGAFCVTTQALAAPPPWAQGRPHADRQYTDRQYADRQYDDARVLEVDPIVRRVRVETPRRECWDEVRTAYPGSRGGRNDAVGPTILGGIIGGVLGHQVGSGRGQDVATVAGTLIGASIGQDAAARRSARGSEEYSEERCQTRYEDSYEERIDGYRVTYEYLGREYTTRMPYDPGDRIRVRVAVSPAE